MTLAALALALALPAAAQQDKAPGVARIEGAFVEGRLPGFGAGGALIGTGPFLSKTLPWRPLAKLGPNFFMKSSGELVGMAGTNAQGWDYLLGGRLQGGMGRIFDGGVYALMSAGLDYDTDHGGYHKGHLPYQDATLVTVGPELGKAWKAGKDGAVYAGVTAGYGWYDYVNGADPLAPTKPRLVARAGLGLGASIEGRLGKPGVPGTVRFSGSAGVFNEAYRANASADIDLTEKISLGGGVRRIHVKEHDPQLPDFTVVYPYARLTYGIGR